MLHRGDGDDDFTQRIQMADLDLIRTSRATATSIAENYIGLAFD
jgi:p-hydroxybenzoate 3-monooxygenase